jgi:hypothetical protein
MHNFAFGNIFYVNPNRIYLIYLNLKFIYNGKLIIRCCSNPSNYLGYQLSGRILHRGINTYFIGYSSYCHYIQTSKPGRGVLMMPVSFKVEIIQLQLNIFNSKTSTMKKAFYCRTCAVIISFIILCITTTHSFAQDSAASSGSATRTTTTTTQQATSIPTWVWVVGGIVVLSIIIGLLSRSKGGEASRTDKVTYTKTTSRDTSA